MHNAENKLVLFQMEYRLLSDTNHTILNMMFVMCKCYSK